MNPSKIDHTTTVRVRYADTDKMGVVYYGNYMKYFEIGRTELLRSIGLPYVELEQAGVLLPVLEAHAEYLLPAKYDDLLEIDATYAVEHTALITMQYTIRRGMDTLVRGYTRHSFVDATTFRPVRPPQIFRSAIEQVVKEGV